MRTLFSIDASERSSAAIADREHVAEAASMARLLNPATVAVIGASREPGKIGNAVMQNLVGQGFCGILYPVNPNSVSVLGIPAYPSVLDVPGPVDVAVVVLPAGAVIGVVDECARKHVHALVIISAGFAETGDDGAALQREIVARARANGMRVVGPNCLGVANADPSVRLNATFAPDPPVPGNVAFLSQSGGLGIELLSQAKTRGIGISQFVSVGNKSDVSGNDLLQYWDEDTRTDVVLLYLESFGNPRKFARIARRVSRHKPIVAVKSGRTPAGSRAASSHTAALASSDVAVDALFRQAGVIRVDTLEELLDTAQMLSTQPIPEGSRVVIIGNVGGPGILAADACRGRRARRRRAPGGHAGVVARARGHNRRGPQPDRPRGRRDSGAVRPRPERRVAGRHRRCGHRHLRASGGNRRSRRRARGCRYRRRLGDREGRRGVFPRRPRRRRRAARRRRIASHDPVVRVPRSCRPGARSCRRSSRRGAPDRWV